MPQNSDRRHERQPVTLLVDYSGRSDLVSDFTENLSMGGTFVQTARSLPVGEEVRLLLSCPGLIDPVALFGVVRWTRARTDADEAGCGIEFTNYDATAREHLQSIIDAIASRDPDYIGQIVNLLVVEDNPLIVNLLRDGLALGRKQLGPSVTFRFAIAADGQQGLELALSEAFDVALIDMYLPVIDGATVIKQLRSEPETQFLPIIAMSAGGRDAADLALASGADRFLSKPIRLKEVLDAIGGVISIAG